MTSERRCDDTSAISPGTGASGSRNQAGARNKREPRIPELFQVVVECDDEQQQKTVYQQMQEGGFRCRVLTL